MPGTVEGIVNNIIDWGSRPMSGLQYERIRAIDEVLDTVRDILFQPHSHYEREELVESLRAPMERVDRNEH